MNALAQPIKKIIKITTGIQIEIQYLNFSESLIPLPVLISFMQFFHPQPFLAQQNMSIVIPPSGKILLETIKSSRSMIALIDGR